MSEVNEVRLRGHLSAAADERILPSGDRLVSFRLVVPRAASARRRSKQTVDTIECSVWTAALRKSVARLSAGEEIAVFGQLRRTFRRQGAATASFVTVDVDSVERIKA